MTSSWDVFGSREIKYLRSSQYAKGLKHGAWQVVGSLAGHLHLLPCRMRALILAGLYTVVVGTVLALTDVIKNYSVVEQSKIMS